MNASRTMVAVLVLLLWLAPGPALAVRDGEPATPQPFVFARGHTSLPTLTIEVLVTTHVEHTDRQATTIAGDVTATVLGDQAMFITFYKFYIGMEGALWEDLTPFASELNSVGVNPGHAERSSFLVTAPAMGDTIIFYAQVYGFVPSIDTVAPQDVFIELRVNEPR